MKITEVYDDFVIANKAKGLSPKTMSYYNETIRRFILWLRDQHVTRIKSITPKIVERYTIELIDTGMRKTSVNTYLRGVRRLLNFATSSKYLKHLPMKLVKAQATVKETFSTLEVERIIAAASAEDMASTIAVLLLGTGIRAKTLINLRVSDINFADCTLALNTSKNCNAYILPLAPQLCRHLDRYISKHSLCATSLLFSNCHGRALTNHSLYKMIQKFLQSIGVERCGIHIFRHTFGKLMVVNGCDAFTLQAWLGHSSIAQSKQYVSLYGCELRYSLKFNPLAHNNI